MGSTESNSGVFTSAFIYVILKYSKLNSIFRDCHCNSPT
uniref:Uncharacterized protein n=1 Tax=Anguilla anguilla TaxID=7936 RepID=A0A0E9TZK3_ANGAN